MAIDNKLIDRAALERFQEAHPDLQSATQIASISEAAFVERYAADIEGGEREARRVYKTAVTVAERAALIWVNIRDAAASPFFAQTLFNNIQDFIDYHLSIPEYDTLFGSQDFIDCDQCRSIFSPAAYFVDLMRFVEENIIKNNTSVEDALKLNARRPDLARITLDCDNAFTLIPYIDLINEVLEAIVTRYPATSSDAYAILEDTDFPANLPFNLPLAQVRSYLQQLKTSLAHLYQAFEASPGANQEAITREFLELSPREFSLLTAEIARPYALSRYYGTDVTAANFGGLTDVVTFLQQTGLSRQELDELVAQNLSQDEINAGLSRLFFINNVDDGLGPLAIADVGNASPPTESLVNLSQQKLDRIYRFVKLARKLGWSLTDLDWAVRSLSQPYTPEQALKFDGVEEYVACRNTDGTLHNLDLTTFTIEAWVNPAQLKKNPILAKGTASGDKTTTHFLFWIDVDGRLGLYHDETGGEQRSNTTFDEVRSVGTIPANVFSHVAVAVDETKARFYINGALDQEVNLPHELTPLGTELHIGHNLNDSYFEGIIKEVRIWRGVRDAAWIASDVYHRMTGLEIDLVGYWPLIPSRWEMVDDLSASHNSGTPGGADLTTQPTWVLRDLVLDPMPSTIDGSGPAFHFNGVDEHLERRAINCAATSELTVEVWVNLDELRDNNAILWLGDEANGNVQLALWAAADGKFNCQTSIANATLTTQTQIVPGLPTHLCISIVGGALCMYINGKLDKEYAVPTGVSFDLQGKTLLVGRSLDKKYYKGTLQELRLWERGRSAAEIAMAMYRAALRGEPGLMGYWPLTEIDAASGITADLSYNANDLYLGGILSDYTPTLADTDLLLPPPPIKTIAPALHFDGINDVVTISNPQDFGLGHYERLTLQLWFRPDDVTSDRQQVLYSQGDGEAGLSAYIAGSKLYVVVWDAAFDLTNFRATVFSTSALHSGQWHHLAVTSDASLTLDTVTLAAYLDGQQFGTASPAYAHPPLSPVGPAYLGGVGENGLTRFQEAYSDARTRSLHYFAGDIADFRLSSVAEDSATIAAERFAAPTPQAADLVAYLPLDEDCGESFADLTGHGNAGVLASRNMGLASRDQQSHWDNVYAHYKDPTGLTWSNYAYTGRIRFRDAGSVGGVTFFSRHLEHQDQFYALWRSSTDPEFHLIAHPLDLRPISSWQRSSVSPAPGAWYCFRIEAVDDGTQTVIKAKVWPEEATEPGDFQISANDASHLRIKAGPIGIGAAPGSGVAVDDLQVQPLTSPSASGPTTPLLVEHFEAFAIGEEPASWSQTGTKQQIVPDATLFTITGIPEGKSLVLGNQGTHSALEDACIHFSGTDAALWSNYTYEGRLYVGDANAALGLTFHSSYPTEDAYYRIRRYQEQPTFQLDRHPVGGPTLHGKLDSGVNPAPATWYRFRIDVQEADTFVSIKARLWEDGTAEPVDFQIDAYDDSDRRLLAGTVGVWTVGSGTKLVDSLAVLHVDLTPGREEVPRHDDDDDDDEGWIHIHGHVGHVQLRVYGDASSAWWTVVQRRDDKASEWHDVWQGNLNERDVDFLQKTMTIDRGDLFAPDEPGTHRWFRWVVYAEQGGTWLFTSDEFRAPTQARYKVVTEATVSLWLATNFGADHAGQVPDGWIDTVTRNQPQDATQLFEAVDFKDNRAQWETQITDYPLLRHPLNRKALSFNGKQEYAAAGLHGLSGNALTLEAWVNPADASRPYPLATLWQAGTLLIALGIDTSGKFTVQTADSGTTGLQSTASVHPGDFVHIAFSIDDNQATFYVNGIPEPALTLVSPLALGSELNIEIGRGPDGTCFNGEVKEIRVWNSARTPAQITARQFEQPELPSADLVAYWPCGEDAGLIVSDASGHFNDLHLGGLDEVRWPTLAPRSEAAPDSHELYPSHVLSFAGPTDYLELSDAGDQPRERRTVEVWFRVDDTTISHRKQIIYREGDDQRGLIMYIHDGSLYFGGFNLPGNESNWPGTWLQTDRITAGAWHQAALVLDGRAEIRPESLQAYLDGKLVDVGPGSQLWQIGRLCTIGGADGSVLFHDGPTGDASSHFLVGQIMDLRLWDTVRTPAEIALYRQVPVQPLDEHLVLWLQAKDLPPDLTFFARGMSGQPGTLVLKRPDQRQPLAVLPVYSLPQTALDKPAMVQIAAMKHLKDDLNIPLNQLSALWYTIKHTGTVQGPTLWNQTFNPKGVVLDPWPPYLDQPIRWEVIGNTDRDRKIRGRLMVALRLALPDLITLVARLSPGETVVELDTDYLTNLYRMARAPGLLGLSVSDFLRLLDMLGIARISRLADFQQVNDRAAWLQQTGVSVAQLDFLANDRQSKLAGVAYNDAAIRDLAVSLTTQSKDFLITAGTFVSNQISQSQALQLFTWLNKTGFIEAAGAVTARYTGPADLSALANQPDWDASLLGKVQSEIDAGLTAASSALAQAVLAGLSGLLGANSDLTRVATAHLAPEMDAVAFFNRMLSIQGALPIPSAVAAYLYHLNKVLYLSNQFALSADAVGALLDHPANFGVKQPVKPDIQDLEHLYIFNALNAAYQNNSAVLLSLLSRAEGDTVGITADVLALTGWEPGQLTALVALLGPVGADRVTWLNRLKQCFDLAASMLVDINFLIQLTATDHLDYDFYKAEAELLLQVLRTGYDDNAWVGVYQPIHDGLATQQRDGLLSLVLQQLGKGYQGSKGADILYEYLLLDVQTGSEVQTSRIVQAIASVQLYVQRCLMNLEKGVLPERIPAQQWAWMQNYRVWEANRKVFLYPENYIEPELRTDKTPLFAQLQQDLAQGEMSQVTVQKAYTNYLEQFKEIATLKITGSYLYNPARGSNKQGQNPNADQDRVLYLMGRTNTDPRTYYYRQFKPDTRQWFPWQKIDPQIPADFVTPVFAFNRLFLFWPEFIKTVKAVDKPASEEDRQNGKQVDSQGYLISNGVRLKENQDVWQPTVKYTYFNFDKSWVQPQTYPFFGATSPELTTEQHLRPEWQRVYGLQSFEPLPTSASVDPQPGNTTVTETEAQVLQFTNDMDIQENVPLSPMVDLTCSFWINFVKSAATPQSVVLFSYGEQPRRLKATVSNNLMPNPQLKQAQDDVQSTQDNTLQTQSQEDSANLNLHIEVGDQDKSVDMELDYRWQHVDITLKYENNGYTVSLYKDGVLVIGPVSLASSQLDAQQTLRIGSQPGNNVITAYTIQMAEFELWNSIRSASEINRDQDLRPAPQDGLFRIPLNRIEAGTHMLIVDSKEKNDPNDKGLSFRLATVSIVVQGLTDQRERLILLYGNKYRSLRDSMDDQNFVLQLIKNPNASGKDYDLDLTPNTLAVTQTDGLSIEDYAINNSTPTLSRYSPYALRDLKALIDLQGTISDNIWSQDWSEIWQIIENFELNPLLKNLSRQQVSLIDVGNQPGWYILDTGEEQFLIRADLTDLETASERLQFNIPEQQKDGTYAINAETVGDPVPVSMYFEGDHALKVQDTDAGIPHFRYTFDRLSTRGVYELSTKLFGGGVDALLSLDAQRAPEWDFGSYEANSQLVMPPTDPVTGKSLDTIDFNGAYGIYYSEIFFHAPFLIANLLNTNQNFAEAQSWYHYIFNPMTQESPGNGPVNDRYWRYLPFRDLNIQTLAQILSDPATLQEYQDDPFDPHAIARLRLVAYQKAIVMKYIDNLIDWGDYLFSQDTRESINEAIPLYVLAYTLLGPKPQSRPARKFQNPGDYSDIKQQNNSPLPDFLLGPGNGASGSSSAVTSTPHSSVVTTSFCVPENDLFTGYWDRVGDRLFKIRHSQNIEGVFRQLALFQPPINPMDLVQAIASGRDVGSVLAGQAIPVPAYRYLFMVDKARDMISTVIDLGSSLLAALESRDEAALALLENSQEQQILDLTTDIKKREFDIAQTTLDALNVSKTSLQAKQQRYQSLIDTGWIPEEIATAAIKSVAAAMRFGKGVAKAIGTAVEAAPQEYIGIVGIEEIAMAEEGGFNFGAIANAIGEGLEGYADGLDTVSDVLAMSGEFSRRNQEWNYELLQIGQELQQVERQIDNATAELANAQQELVIHYKTMAQNREIAAFLRSKFSSQDLYTWMIARLSGLYFQAYRLAYNMAKSTERALQYELGTDDTFISFGYWDSLKKGLLAGESLMLDLNRMNKAFLDRNRRRLQIEKKISLQRSIPTALADLKTKGMCEFELSEALFDRDFPGHYFRTITTLALTINAQADDIDGIHATLIELGDKVLLQPDAGAVRFLLHLDGATEPDTSKVRTNWAANQQIAVSRVDADGDNGMFVLDFIFDDRYFPFEGTGVVSTWRLEMPKDTNSFDFNTIQDVVIHLKYSAKADNGKFRDDVRKLIASVK